MHSFLTRTFGGLTGRYYARHFLFAAAFAAFLFWAVSNGHGGIAAKPGMVFFVVINTLLYPYSRFVYESVVGYVMGDNVFYVNAALMLTVKAITMSACWSFAIFVAPVGLAFLYWRNSRTV
ncbi:hypothetical protein AABC73_01750 [Pseudomonas sp. G.S.17]|uniref:hypothetical protein n=1 Tax=Pseudomonas sp. G.S.17 TaxID=3137451 RepID=UPI00311CB35E